MKRKKDKKTEMYLCGEKYSRDYEMTGDYFFDSIIKFFGIKKLKEGHSGDLSQYLYWMVLGVVFVVLMLMVVV